MKIESAEIRYVELPLISPWRTAYGEDATIHSVIVRLDGGGQQAWGEATPFFAPTYSPESAISVYETARQFLLPRVVGEEVDLAAELLDLMSIYKGNPFAKAAVETAWWGLQSKILEKPLWRVLGGASDEILCGADFGVQDTIDDLLGLIQGAVDARFPRIKLKAKHGWDVEMLEAVRSAFPDPVIHVDCNSGYDLHEDEATLRAFDRFNLAMIEQPLQYTDLIEHAELQKMIETPVCLDESVKSPRDFTLAVKVGACKVINVKPGRVGGLYHSKQIHDMAVSEGIEAWVGGMLESGIGAGICAALGTLSGFGYPADLFPSTKWYVEDITEHWIELDDDCRVRLGDRAGVGYEPVPERLERVTTHKCVVS
ncbi:TPA: o-succinylbenzoate synthase [Candidatus Latescibacteria bacterium]|nr:o-succinylbenzoate synthase [Candidatus Latescibacterota bacterium]|tara:strand:+ start:303 stop:1412 length:1110 start_codon:yes stop_codon:yes gene_type:complete